MAILIGLTGENCAGKGTAAEYLQKKGFYYLSLSDVIREALADEGKEITREALIAKGNQMRAEDGAGILAKKTLAKVQPGRNYVIDSIRNPAEAQALLERKEFTLIYITASPRIRFERMKKRRREGDPRSFESFLAIEARELDGGSEHKQRLRDTFALATKKITNEAGFRELYDQIDALLAELSSEFKPTRPAWDEYFMGIAQVVATRSNCIKRQVAAVIVKDRRIVSTGYNGTPRGVKNCNEGGCARCNSFADSGTKLDECVCSHGEENAIVQAAYHGIAIKGATLYTTFSPCLACSKMIVNSGIAEVVYNEAYPMGETATRLLSEAGIILRQYRMKQH
jgi:dCMP deaminase